jgi:hypothetical protein
MSPLDVSSSLLGIAEFGERGLGLTIDLQPESIEWNPGLINRQGDRFANLLLGHVHGGHRKTPLVMQNFQNCAGIRNAAAYATRRTQQHMGIESVTATSAQRPHRRILVFRTHRLIEVAFKHVAFEFLLLALDAISTIDRPELFRHLSRHLEKPNLGADWLVFNRLADGELERHARTFLCGLTVFAGSRRAVL